MRLWDKIAETEPVTCPTCKSDDISYERSFEAGSIKVVCQEMGCDSSWWEIWEFSHIEMIEGKDNRRKKE